MKLLNVKSVSALALSIAVSTAAFAKFTPYTPDPEDFKVVKSSLRVPVHFKPQLEAQDKAAQAQEEYDISYRKIIREKGVAAAKYCGQKAISATENIIEFGPVKYAINMAVAYGAVTEFGGPFIDFALDISGAVAGAVVGPAGPAVASGLKFVNKAMDWIPGVREAKNVLIAAAVKDFVAPGAIGAAKLVYNNAGTVYNGAAKAASYLANWWNGAAVK
jgi:hypothetical protein